MTQEVMTSFIGPDKVNKKFAKNPDEISSFKDFMHHRKQISESRTKNNLSFDNRISLNQYEN